MADESSPPGIPGDPNFDVLAKVAAYVAKHGREQLDLLYGALPAGRSVRTIDEWYARDRAAGRQAREDAERSREDKHLELQERTVAAAELSAKAAVLSARWAKAALWITLTALGLAAFEHFSK